MIKLRPKVETVYVISEKMGEYVRLEISSYPHQSYTLMDKKQFMEFAEGVELTLKQFRTTL